MARLGQLVTKHYDNMRDELNTRLSLRLFIEDTVHCEAGFEA